MYENINRELHHEIYMKRTPRYWCFRKNLDQKVKSDYVTRVLYPFYGLHFTHSIYPIEMELNALPSTEAVANSAKISITSPDLLV